MQPAVTSVKISALLFSFFFSFNAMAITIDERVQFLVDVRMSAARALMKAHKNTRSTLARNVYESIFEKLKVVTIRVPLPGYPFPHCLDKNETIAAWAEDGEIFLCDSYLQTLSYPVSAEAMQTIIHETAHVVGYNRECNAIRMEYSAMNDAGIRPFPNSFLKRDPCDGLDTTFVIRGDL